MPAIHFYDTLTAGRSPSEGQVLRFDSALLPLDGEALCSTTNIRLRDDLFLDPVSLLDSELALLPLDEGCSELEWARSAFQIFSRPSTLHVGFGSSTRHDPYIRSTFYRNLLPHPCLGLPANSHFLDLDVLLRAIQLIRPDELPWPTAGLKGGINGLYNFLMWEAGLGPENRAFRVKELLGSILETSPKLANHALTVSSPAQIKSVMGMDAGEVWDLNSVKPVVMVHPSLPDKRGAILAVPVAADVSYPDLICMVDLECDLSELCSESTVNLQHLVRNNKGDRSAPLFHVSLNRIPFVAPISAIRPVDAKRLGIDISVVKQNIKLLSNSNHLVGRLREEPVLQLPPQPVDADFRQWAGEFPIEDLDLMRQLHAADFSAWPSLLIKGTDRRLRDLGGRMLGRYQVDALTAGEKGLWQQHLVQRVSGDSSPPFRLEPLLKHAEDMELQYPTAPGVIGLRDRLLRLKGMINDT
ncbi:hypothetical protein [Pseudomonas sp.]|uniref:hypothetical protein n=1 Tax=Pseudomonas sp. TaxID=306 RepID=UPI0029158DEA|nr:hypothetical protein [Pseudomonas sp.]MDU4254155.1 hypothetical protein [Pseudomonas sp.]